MSINLGDGLQYCSLGVFFFVTVVIVVIIWDFLDVSETASDVEQFRNYVKLCQSPSLWRLPARCSAEVFLLEDADVNALHCLIGLLLEKKTQNVTSISGCQAGA